MRKCVNLTPQISFGTDFLYGFYREIFHMEVISKTSLIFWKKKGPLSLTLLKEHYPWVKSTIAMTSYMKGSVSNLHFITSLPYGPLSSSFYLLPLLLITIVNTTMTPLLLPSYHSHRSELHHKKKRESLQRGYSEKIINNKVTLKWLKS